MHASRSCIGTLVGLFTGQGWSRGRGVFVSSDIVSDVIKGNDDPINGNEYCS